MKEVQNRVREIEGEQSRATVKGETRESGGREAKRERRRERRRKEEGEGEEERGGEGMRVK